MLWKRMTSCQGATWVVERESLRIMSYRLSLTGFMNHGVKDLPSSLCFYWMSPAPTTMPTTHDYCTICGNDDLATLCHGLLLFLQDEAQESGFPKASQSGFPRLRGFPKDP
jgi:hypothetical protein